MPAGHPEDTDAQILRLPKAALTILRDEAKLRNMEINDLLASLILSGWFHTYKDADPAKAARLAQEFTNEDLDVPGT